MKPVTVAIALLCTPIMVFAQVASEGSEQGTSACIPTPVRNLQVQPGATSLALTWSKPETLCPGGKTEVVVRWAVGEKKTSRRFDETVENYEVQDLQPWTTVMLKVFIQHTDNNNLTHDSEKAQDTVTTLKKKPSPPRHLQVVDKKLSEDGEGAEMYVQWEAPEMPNGPIDGYVYKVCWGLRPCAASNDYTDCSQEKDAGNDTRRQITRLTPLMYYEMSLRAFNKDDGQPRLKSDAAKVCDRAPAPEIPQLKDVKVQCAAQPKKITVSWKEPEQKEHWERYQLVFSANKGGNEKIIKKLDLNSPTACKQGKCSAELTDGLAANTQYSITISPYMKKIASFVEDFLVLNCKISSGQQSLQSSGSIVITLFAIFVMSIVKLT